MISSIVGREFICFLQLFRHRVQSKSHSIHNGFGTVGCEFHCSYNGISIVFQASPVEFTMVSASWGASSIAFYKCFNIALKANPIHFTVVSASWGASSIVLETVSESCLKQLPSILQWFKHRGARLWQAMRFTCGGAWVLYLQCVLGFGAPPVSGFNDWLVSCTVGGSAKGCEGLVGSVWIDNSYRE